MSLNFFSQVELVARVTQAPASPSSQSPNASDLVSVLTVAKQVVNPKLQELVGFRGRDDRCGWERGMGGGRAGDGGYIWRYVLIEFVYCMFNFQTIMIKLGSNFLANFADYSSCSHTLTNC